MKNTVPPTLMSRQKSMTFDIFHIKNRTIIVPEWTERTKLLYTRGQVLDMSSHLATTIKCAPPAVYTCMALFMYNFRANFSQNDIKDRFISQDKKRNKNKKKVGDG